MFNSVAVDAASRLCCCRAVRRRVLAAIVEASLATSVFVATFDDKGEERRVELITSFCFKKVEDELFSEVLVVASRKDCIWR